MVSHEPDLTC